MKFHLIPIVHHHYIFFIPCIFLLLFGWNLLINHICENIDTVRGSPSGADIIGYDWEEKKTPKKGAFVECTKLSLVNSKCYRAHLDKSNW